MNGRQRTVSLDDPTQMKLLAMHQAPQLQAIARRMEIELLDANGQLTVRDLATIAMLDGQALLLLELASLQAGRESMVKVAGPLTALPRIRG